MTTTEGSTPPQGLHIPKEHRIVARVSLIGTRGEAKGHAIRCSCERWIEADVGATSRETARALAETLWVQHAGGSVEGSGPNEHVD